MQAETLNNVTLQDVLMFINQNTDNSSASDDAIKKNLIQEKPKKRIGLMPIDPKVYECLEQDTSDLFE